MAGRDRVTLEQAAEWLEATFPAFGDVVRAAEALGDPDWKGEHGKKIGAGLSGLADNSRIEAF